MQRPDHALQDSTRLRFLTQHAEPPEGLTTVRADLGTFLIIVDRVGRNEALLLLVVKALRQRTGLLALRVNDLAWMLRVSNRRVIRWLDRLVRHRFVVYHVEDLWGIDTVLVEIIGGPVDEQSRFARTITQDLPTHWFVQVLPVVGRTTFAVFLYFLWCEPHRPLSHIDHLVTSLRLRGRMSAAWHIARLRRHALLADHEEGGFTVQDPAPPARLRRLQLRFLAIPLLRRTLVHLLLLALLAAIGVTILFTLPLFHLPLR
jgi:hypothetical protein